MTKLSIICFIEKKKKIEFSEIYGTDNFVHDFAFQFDCQYLCEANWQRRGTWWINNEDEQTIQANNNGLETNFLRFVWTATQNFIDDSNIHIQVKSTKVLHTKSTIIHQYPP